MPVYPGVLGNRHAFLEFFKPVEDDVDSGTCGDWPHLGLKEVRSEIESMVVRGEISYESFA